MTERTGLVTELTAVAIPAETHYNVLVKGNITTPTPGYETKVTLTAVDGGKLKVFLKLQHVSPDDDDTGPGFSIQMLDIYAFAHTIKMSNEARAKQLELTAEGHPPVHAAITYAA